MQNNNIVGGNTTVFKYDKGGNLQYKKEYTYSAATGKTYTDLLNGTGKTISYGYGVSSNKDLLTSYNGSGTLEYDNYGNPKKWFKHSANNSSLGYTLQWGHVSNLIAITDNDAGKRYTYKYNDQGIRTEKVVNGVVHKYYLQGEQIIAERYGGSLIKFYYDSTGVCGFRYYNKEKDGDNSNGTDYYYQKNIQGDILRIFDKNGNLKAEYSYDAWGKCTIKTNVNNIATINPFRYRGYYLDDETGLYYLNSRYYDPEVGRFISRDSIEYANPETINGLNLYAYCLNNPVMCVDPTGTLAWWQNLLIALAGIVIIAGLAVATVVTGGAAAGLAGAIAAGALKGALIGGVIGIGVGAGIGYAVGGVDGMLTGMAIGFTAGVIIGAVIGGISGGVTYSPLKAASNAAFKAKPAKGFNINKHLNSAGGRHSKFISDSVDDIVSMDQKGLRSQNILIKTNKAAKSWQIIVDVGQVVGTKGQTAIRVIVGYGGKIWTMFPVFL